MLREEFVKRMLVPVKLVAYGNYLFQPNLIKGRFSSKLNFMSSFPSALMHPLKQIQFNFMIVDLASTLMWLGVYESLTL